MKSLSILTLVVALTAAHELLGAQANCQFWAGAGKNATYFDFNKLANNTVDYKVPYHVSKTLEKTLNFNFCLETVTNCTGAYGGDAYASSWDDENHCASLTNATMFNSNKEVVLHNPDAEKEEDTWLEIVYLRNGTASPKCETDPTQTYGVTFNMKCNKNITGTPEFKVMEASVDGSDCHPVVDVYSSHTC